MRKILLSLCLILSVVSAHAGAVTNTYGELGSYHYWKCQWVGGTNEYYVAATSKFLIAETKMAVIKACTSTGETVSATINTDDGIDILGGKGTLTATNASQTAYAFAPCLGHAAGGSTTNAVPYVFNSALTLIVTNCFETNITRVGTIILYYAP